jgi:hypothetical protein
MQKGWRQWIPIWNGCVWLSVCRCVSIWTNSKGNVWPAGTTATVVITGAKDRDASQESIFRKIAHRLREFG